MQLKTASGYNGYGIVKHPKKANSWLVVGVFKGSRNALFISEWKTKKEAQKNAKRYICAEIDARRCLSDI